MRWLALGLTALTGVGLWHYLTLLAHSSQWGDLDVLAAAVTATWLLVQFIAAGMWASDEWLAP